jgi:putative restriction endonuclease
MTALMPDRDQRLRLAAFDWLEHQRQLHGDTLERSLLLAGFTFDGVSVPLVSAQQGIFKPAILDLPLSITTTPPSDRKPRPYDDEFSPDGLLRYRYRGTDAGIATTPVSAKRCGASSRSSISTASCLAAT